jgi:hypothetical protein
MVNKTKERIKKHRPIYRIGQRCAMGVIAEQDMEHLSSVEAVAEAKKLCEESSEGDDFIVYEMVASFRKGADGVVEGVEV